jgi:hypothetical protein
LVEFIRLNPRFLFGLSEAQLISLVLISLGFFLYYRKPTTFNETAKTTVKSSGKQVKKTAKA